MDCCYSGNWAERYKKMEKPEEETIDIYCSVTPDLPSWDNPETGGYFMYCHYLKQKKWNEKIPGVLKKMES